MLARIYLSLTLLTAMPAWSQMGMNATGGSSSGDEALMQVPPPVSGDAYPTAVGSEARSNYLRAGLVVNTAYSDNVLSGSGTNPVSDVSYSIFPTIAIDQTTPRLHWILNYSPGFTIYQHTSSYDQADQNVAMNFQYRFSPHVTASLRESFQKTSNVFNQPDSLSGAVISGSAQPPAVAVIAPNADQLTNTATMQLTYQFSRNGMIGVAGAFTNLHYPNPAEVPGLYDSSSSGGSAFYNHRLSKMHYVGVTYQHSRILADPLNAPGETQTSTILAYPVNAPSETQTNAILLFYTIYLKPTLSFSVSGGPQRYNVVQSPFPAYHSSSPALAATMAWQTHRTNFAASYLRVVTSGGGLVGAFHSNGANASGRWQLARTWGAGFVASYLITKDVTPSSFVSSSGGHTLSGTVSVQHPLSEYLNVGFGYTRLHQSYSGIPVISNAPNTNREFISISYQFARPLGR